MRSVRLGAAGVLVALGGSVLVGTAPQATAALAATRDVSVIWPDITWVAGSCSTVPFSWQTSVDLFELRVSTQDISGRPVDLSGGAGRNTADVLLAEDPEAGDSGVTSLRVCSPLDPTEARRVRLVLTVDRYSRPYISQTSTPLFPSAPAVGQPIPPGPIQGTWSVRNGRAIVTWSSPLDAGDFPVTGYEYRVDSGPWKATSSRRAVVTGLEPWQTTRVRIRAVSSAGPGPEDVLFVTWQDATRGPANPGLPRCGPRIERDSLPEPVYGKRCVAKVDFGVRLVKGQSPVSFSRYDFRKRYWNFRVEAPNKDWRVRGTMFRRTASGTSVILRWSHGSDGYRIFNSYVYPGRVGPGSFGISNVVSLTVPTEYTWVRTDEDSGRYEVSNRTRLTETISVYFRVG